MFKDLSLDLSDPHTPSGAPIQNESRLSHFTDTFGQIFNP